VPTRITDYYIEKQRFCRPNLDISHRCILRCPQCIRQKTTSQDQIRRSFDLQEQNFKKILNYYVAAVTFCGQISDPIYHPEFLDFLKMCDGSGRQVRIATNGSGHSLDWWTEAFQYGLGENAWYFGVDGIDKKSEIYRIGSNFENVWEMMKLGRDLGHVIVWQYIIFDYNEHEIDSAIEIAKDEDFSLLFVNTNRGFIANHPLLRKSVDFNIKTPDKKYLEDRVKKEWWGHRTDKKAEWDRLSIRTKRNT